MSLITFETLERHQRWAERVYGERCKKLVHLVESSQPLKPENLVWVFRAWQKNRKTSRTLAYPSISKIKKVIGMYFLPRDWYPDARGRRTRLIVSMIMRAPVMKYPDKHVISTSFSRDVTDEELLWTVAHEYKHYLQYVKLGKFTRKSHEMEVEADKFANDYVNFENPNIRKWAKFPTLNAV